MQLHHQAQGEVEASWHSNLPQLPPGLAPWSLTAKLAPAQSPSPLCPGRQEWRNRLLELEERHLPGAVPVLQKYSWLLLANFTRCHGTTIVYKFILSPERLRLTCWRKGNAPSQNLCMNFCFIISKRCFPSIKCTFNNRFETNPSNGNRIDMLNNT